MTTNLRQVTHASEWVTISNSYFHDHSKASLVGHSDSNAAEDTGHLHVTYANNHWNNVGSRAPSVRFGTAHVYNSYYEAIETTGINTRMGAQVLVESTVFNGVKNPLLSKGKPASAKFGIWFTNGFIQTARASDMPLSTMSTSEPRRTLRRLVLSRLFRTSTRSWAVLL